MEVGACIYNSLPGRRKALNAGLSELWCYLEDISWMQYSDLLCWVSVQPAKLNQCLSSELDPAEKV